MQHEEFLTNAAKILGERASEYGGVQDCFDRIAKIATIILGREITKRDVALIQVAVKLGRLPESPEKVDTFVDAINYMSFAGEFSQTPVAQYELPMTPHQRRLRDRELMGAVAAAVDKVGDHDAP